MVDKERLVDEFCGDNRRLIGSAGALLDLDAEGALVPHGIGGHARKIIGALARRLADIEAASDPAIEGDLVCKVMSYDHAHEDAVGLGYPSITEALEALDAGHKASPNPSPESEA